MAVTNRKSKEDFRESKPKAKEVPIKETSVKESVLPKKEDKKVEPVVTRGYVHVDTFLGTAQPFFNMSGLQVQGFRAFMTGKQYQASDQDFIPYLEKYLGRSLK